MTIQTRRQSAAEALVAVAMAFAPIVANAQTVVVGRDDPAVDVPAVQAAVDLGGSVLLVGAFDLGEAGRITLVRDVEISGEAGQGTGVPLTTIRRGEWSFHTPFPSSLPLPPAQPGPKVAIHHIGTEAFHFIVEELAPSSLSIFPVRHDIYSSTLLHRYCLRDALILDPNKILPA